MPDSSSMVRLEGIEPPTYSLGNWRSVRLSYRRMYTLLYRFLIYLRKNYAIMQLLIVLESSYKKRYM